MAWLTPDELPEGTACRPLYIPDNSEWLAIVSGAILELTRTWNWEQFGTLTPEQCAERMQIMQQAYYDGDCNFCVMPDGERVIRINLNGHFEELFNGTWQSPTGDYALPPVPEREGGTPQEQRCLAAANAENVLAQLYEETTDAFESGLTAAQTILELATLLGLIIAPPMGLLGKAVMTIGAIVFREFFDFMDFLTEDFWDATFSEALRCMLYECSLNTDGVVTFDLQCLNNKLGENTNPFDLSGAQVRLLGQVSYLLSVIGNDGLNLAGATTAIETADCGECDDAWCFTFNLEETDADGSPVTVNGCTATWAAAAGWSATKGGGCATPTGASVLAAISISYPSTYIRKVVVVTESAGRTGGNLFAIVFPAINRGGAPVVVGLNVANGEPLGCQLNINAMSTGITAEAQNGAPSGVTHSSGTTYIKQVTFYGNGECPFGSPNCFE